MRDKDAQLMMEALKEAQWGSEPSGSHDTTGQQQPQPAQQEPAAGQQVDLTALLATQNLDDFRKQYEALLVNHPQGALLLDKFDQSVDLVRQMTRMEYGQPAGLWGPGDVDTFLKGASRQITRFGGGDETRTHFEALVRADVSERQ